MHVHEALWAKRGRDACYLQKMLLVELKKRTPESRALRLLGQALIWRRGAYRGRERAWASLDMTSSLAQSAPNEARPVSRNAASAADQVTRPGEEPKIEAGTQGKTEGEMEDRVRERRLEAAKRALSEARERRAEAQKSESEVSQAGKGERNGRGGLDPVRYGDWEVKGIASDF